MSIPLSTDEGLPCVSGTQLRLELNIDCPLDYAYLTGQSILSQLR